MIRVLLVVLIGCNPLFVCGQTIHGTIKDSKTGEPLPFTNIFINNSTIGTVSDAGGNYLLPVPEGFAELIVSYVGYRSQSKQINPVKGEVLILNFTLEPEIKNLGEVEVNETRDKEWEKKIKQFEKEFLGTTSNGKKSKILNPWVVNFVETDRKALIANASEPIEIENVGLGYKISFELIKFDVSNKLCYFLGKTRFTEMTPENEKQKKIWMKNRMNAYLGNERHLFAAILNRRVHEEGFELYTEIKEKKDIKRSAYFNQERNANLSSFTFVLTGPKQEEYKLSLPGRLEVHYTNDNQNRFYRDDNCRVYWITPTKPSLEVNAKGVLRDPTSIITSGYTRYLRVADMLPNDFEPEKSESRLKK